MYKKRILFFMQFSTLFSAGFQRFFHSQKMMKLDHFHNSSSFNLNRTILHVIPLRLQMKKH